MFFISINMVNYLDGFSQMEKIEEGERHRATGKERDREGDRMKAKRDPLQQNGSQI